MTDRTPAWLNNRLDMLWKAHFPDVPCPEPICIRFGQKARTRLGSIRRRQGITTITLSGYFRDTAIPDHVLDETIVHELIHYAHGFESPLPQRYRHPHAGGIVQRELKARQLWPLHRRARRWLKAEWTGYLRAQGVPRRRPRRVRPARTRLLIDQLLKIW